MVDHKKSLKFIANTEKVARIVFSPSHISEGRVSPKAFRLEILKGGVEDYISVLRDEEHRLKEVSANFRPRTKGDDIYGYTLLNADEIRKLNGEIENRKDVSADIDYFQKELALLCKDLQEF